MNPLVFLQANLVRFVVYGALLFLYSALMWFHGYTKGKEKLFDYRDQQATQAIKLVVKQGATTERVVTKYIRVVGHHVPVDRVIEKEVIVYADAPHAAVLDNAHCLSPDWARLHDAAALGVIPAAAGTADGKGEAPTAAASIAAVTGNYAQHHACVDRLDALQEWVNGQAALPR